MNKSSLALCKIIIVDDNSKNLGLLFNILDSIGYDVRIAQDGESAIAKIKRDPPDLILLDVMMPGMDGFKVCSQLKSDPNLTEIPVIFMTALSETVDKLKGLQLGAVDYITKPFSHDEVIARLQLHLKLYQTTQKLKQEVIERSKAELALSQLNQELERQVKERTNQLETTLEQLQKINRELLARKQQLEYMASHDSLTGLPNRNWLMSRLENLINRKKVDSDFDFAVMYIDLDHFKVINDSMGHIVGDGLLNQVAQRLLKTSGKACGSVVRLGGDEFVILLENICHIQKASSLAEAILNQFKLPLEWEDYQYYINASIGITHSSFGYQNAAEVLRDADLAMYSAKRAGRGCYQLLTTEHQKQAALRLELEQELRKAIKNKEFCLYYQPIVSLTTGELVGFEALVRWQHPTRGVVSPGLFIPIAEETGLIYELGDWILHSAIGQWREWQQQFPSCLNLVLHINLSPLQLSQDNLFTKLEQILIEHNLERSGLKLEITESCFISNQVKASRVLERVREIGLQLCIDDFGTGYSCLSHLQELPLDSLKIDRTFVMHLGQKDDAIVRAIIALAHNLGMEVVAEGIETFEQWQELRALGCEWGQGYLFAKPMDIQLATKAIAALEEGTAILITNPSVFEDRIAN
ncbi:MAG: EAL domain-containing protein [Lyngbya sp.]|nr:EAL domain-containing protein [Lyngbya sp.]